MTERTKTQAEITIRLCEHHSNQMLINLPRLGTMCIYCLQQRYDRAIEMLNDVHHLAVGHHADEQPHLWLHCLTVDIPRMIADEMAVLKSFDPIPH